MNVALFERITAKIQTDPNRWPDRHGDYHADCPYCHKPAKRNHVHFRISQDGLCYCQVCHNGSSLAALAKHLGIEMTERDTAQSETTYDYHDAGGKLVYQVVRYYKGSVKNFYQRRPDERGGWVNKLEGVERVLYHLPEVLSAVKRGETVYVVEGEKDAESLRLRGLVATTNAGGAGKWDERYSLALEGADVVVLPDNDDTGKEHGRTVLRSLRGHAKRVTAFLLPGLPDKGDVSDWLTAGHTVEELKDICATQTEEAPEPRTWLTEDELENLPDPVWLLGHELIAGEVNTVFGLSGVGKTFYAIDRALQVATQTGGGVMYVAAEDVRGVKARKNAWRTFHKQAGGAFYVWPEEVNLMDPLATAGFLLQIREIPLALIVFDTLSQCAVGGDTSNNHDMTIFMNACIRICRETGAAILLVHHTDKNGLNYLGAQAIRASSYMMIQLADEDGVIKVICNKSRPSMPFDSYRLRIVGVGDSAVVLPAGQVSDRDAPLTEHQRKALEILNYTIFSTTGATLGDLKGSTGIPEGSIYRVLNSLKDRGYLSQGTKGHPYYITEKGRIAASNYHGKGPQQEAQLSQLSRNHQAPIDSSSPTAEQLSSLSHPYDVIDDSSGGDSRARAKNGHVMGFDWKTVERYFAIGDEEKIKLHCGIWRKDFDKVMASLRAGEERI